MGVTGEVLVNDEAVARNRVKQVFRYLHELHQLRNPVKRQLAEQPWYRRMALLPTHETVAVTADLASRLGRDHRVSDDTVLRVERPELRRAPALPPDLVSWVDVNQTNPDVIPVILRERRRKVRETNEAGEEQEREVVERFDENPERTEALESWQQRWEQWAEAERPALRAMEWFDDLYALYGAIEREGDAVELLTADGTLIWTREEGSIRHPLVLQRVQLQLQTDGSAPAFILSETEDGPELYTALLQTFAEVPATALSSFQQQFDAGDVHPFGDAARGFLRGLVSRISARGTLVEGLSGHAGADPVISLDPVLLLRRRTTGFAAAAQGVIEAIDADAPIPGSLSAIVGIERAQAQTDEEGGAIPRVDEPDDVLLSKPANEEQIRIAERLNRHGAVLVQGPPGTGKSHTIANLIGHLLAQGKSILVTSHTSKALKVLREHVAEDLRPLCVTVLDDDNESRRQLEGAVRAIVDRISSSDKRQLAREAESTADERERLLAELKEVRVALRDAISDEYRPIVVDGIERAPAEAARLVASEASNASWIPRPIIRGAPLPLDPAEFVDLYATNDRVTPEDEALLAEPLPLIDQFPTPADFAALLETIRGLADQDGDFGASLWKGELSTDGAEAIKEVAQSVQDTIAALADENGWEFAAVAAGRRGPDGRRAWESLANDIDEAAKLELVVHAERFELGPALPAGIPLSEQAETAAAIEGYLGQGGRIGKIQRMLRPTWGRFIAAARIGNAEPRTLAHFQALQRQIRFEQTIEALAGRWKRQMEPFGVAPFSQLGPQPAATCKQIADRMRRLLDWTNATWPNVEERIGALGFDWPSLLVEQPFVARPDGDLIQLRDAAAGPLQAALSARCVKIWRARAEAALAEWLSLASEGQPWATNLVAHELGAAMTARDHAAYEAAYRKLASLTESRSVAVYRAELLNRLCQSASEWALAISHREGAHGGSDVPGDVRRAWEWAQLSEELDYRASTSIDALQRAADELLVQLRRVTIRAIDRFTWAFQLNRINLQAQQALVGWQAIMRRIGAGTGKRVPQLRQQAKAAMREARSAVPVWIMPLSRVADSFDPRTTSFDVVIIDEASQSDITSLLALFLGKQVLVVGDHEQVSPSAVGQRQEPVDALIRTYLEGIPNAGLYDGKLSVYELARMAFGGTIALREHFRCVPEIIAFSNALAYDGRIKPLRESATVPLKPHVVAFRVDGAVSSGKVNDKEAEAIVALIAAMIEQPEYDGKTFGVVSLVGEEQAVRIMGLLAHRLSPSEVQSRRIVCGNAAQFQGDERDVMLLSLVDAPADGGPLSLRQTPEFKQRFNVAASRARDQMWVVYSLDPSTDLKPGDLRRQLIEFARDPDALKRAQQEAVRSAESPFEVAVIERLVSAGYRVLSQVEVGYYRIDIVVEGGGKRLAVECDGDRWHPLDAIPADMARQAVLERLGWRFARIRGSTFFRNPAQAMEPVFEALAQHGVTPEGLEAAPDDNVGQSTELRDRTTRRAAEILAAWRANDADDARPETVARARLA